MGSVSIISPSQLTKPPKDFRRRFKGTWAASVRKRRVPSRIIISGNPVKSTLRSCILLAFDDVRFCLPGSSRSVYAMLSYQDVFCVYEVQANFKRKILETMGPQIHAKNLCLWLTHGKATRVTIYWKCRWAQSLRAREVSSS